MCELPQRPQPVGDTSTTVAAINIRGGSAAQNVSTGNRYLWATVTVLQLLTPAHPIG
jgi:hypothetical protein